MSGRAYLIGRPDGILVRFRCLLLGHEVELRVAGKVARTATGWTTNRDGDLDAVVGEKAVQVDTVWVLDPEDM